MKEIYVFSGLGVDERVFKGIEFSGYEPVFIKWVSPLPFESMGEYAERIVKQINNQNPIIVGLSFGGMMAIEVSKIIKTEKVILIASAKTSSEIPFYFRIFGNLKLHKLVPSSLLKQANFFSYWLFGTENPDKELLKEILRDTDPVFLSWAIDKIVTWKNNFIPENLFHIHGSSDRILPITFVKPDITIKDAGHFMTINRVAEINSILKKLL